MHVDYKTAKTHGVDETLFDEKGEDDDLNRFLDYYAHGELRGLLCHATQKQGDLLLFTNGGAIITEQYWSSMFTDRLILQSELKKKATNASLRKAYRVWRTRPAAAADRSSAHRGRYRRHARYADRNAPPARAHERRHRCARRPGW